MRPVYKYPKELPIETTAGAYSLLLLVCQEFGVQSKELRRGKRRRSLSQAHKNSEMVACYILSRCGIPATAISKAFGYETEARANEKARWVRKIMLSESNDDMLLVKTRSILNKIP